jgi:pilus assembly protein Flp/PilA
MLQRIKSTGVRLWKDERGASLLEYSVLIGLILAVSVGLIIGIGGWAQGRWSALDTAVKTPAP